MSKKISIVVACFQDELAILEMYKRITNAIKEALMDYEIIFVNDGSTDNTEEILENICRDDKKVTAIFHSRNFGLQNAFTSGMNQSSGDAVILLDGDMQDPPELIEQFFEQWQNGNQVVYGRRIKRIKNFNIK